MYEKRKEFVFRYSIDKKVVAVNLKVSNDIVQVKLK